MPVAFPIEIVVDDNALGRTDNAVGLGQIIARQRLGIGIDQSRPPIEPLTMLRIAWPFGLQMVKLSDAHARYKNAPDIAPTVVARIELDDFFRLSVFDIFMQQQPPRHRTLAIDFELHAILMEIG